LELLVVASFYFFPILLYLIFFSFVRTKRDFPNPSNATRWCK
jgi:hypothetical protein